MSTLYLSCITFVHATYGESKVHYDIGNDCVTWFLTGNSLCKYRTAGNSYVFFVGQTIADDVRSMDRDFFFFYQINSTKYTTHTFVPQRSVRLFAYKNTPWEEKTSLTFEYDSAMLILGFLLLLHSHDRTLRVIYTHTQSWEGAFACYTAKRRG